MSGLFRFHHLTIVTLTAALLAPGLVSCSGRTLRAWQLQAEGALEELPLPDGAAARPAQTSADLDGDGALETVCLSEGAASIQAGLCGEERISRWITPEDWQVTQAVVGDHDHSGLPEAGLVVWRPFKPWPIDTMVPNPGRINAHQDSAGMSCHVILIGWREGRFREVWAGSALANPLLAVVSADLNDDGWPELAALERDYDAVPGTPAHALTVWGWNGFGFDLLARAEGHFSGLSVYDAPGGAVYLETW